MVGVRDTWVSDLKALKDKERPVRCADSCRARGLGVGGGSERTCCKVNRPTCGSQLQGSWLCDFGQDLNLANSIFSFIEKTTVRAASLVSWED